MEREVSSITHMGVGLILLSLTIGIIVFTVQISNTFKAESMESIMSIESQISGGEVSSMENGSVYNIPVASLYYIVNKQSGAIAEIVYGGTTYNQDTMSSEFWISNFFDDIGIGGKINVLVIGMNNTDAITNNSIAYIRLTY